MTNNNSESIIHISGTKVIFSNSFDLNVSSKDPLFPFEGNEVTILEFFFDHYAKNNEGPDFECYPQAKIQVTDEDGKTHTTSAWFDELKPRPQLFDIYLEGLNDASKFNFDDLKGYEIEAERLNKYETQTEKHRIYNLGFTCMYYKRN